MASNFINGKISNGNIQTFSPLNLNAGIWFDVLDLNPKFIGFSSGNYSIDNSPVSLLKDRTVNSLNLIQPSVPNQLKLDIQSSYMNGKPALISDGSNDYLSLNLTGHYFSDPSITNQLTYYVVFNQYTAIGTDPVITTGTTNAELYLSRGCILGTFSENPTTSVHDGINNYVSNGSLYSINTPTIAAIRWSSTGTASGLEVWINGVKKSTGTITPDIEDNSHPYMTVAVSNTFNLVTAAFVAFSHFSVYPVKHTDKEILQVERYLSRRSKISV